MGYRIMLLIIIFLIIIGGITIVLGRKQVNAKGDLVEAVTMKQAQQLANSAVQEGIRLLKVSVDSRSLVPNAPPPIPLPFNAISNIGGSVINISVFDNIYKGIGLDPGTYAVVANVLATGSNGETYRAMTEAMYTYYTTDIPPYVDVSDLFTNIDGRYFVVFEMESIYIYTASQYFSIPSTLNYNDNAFVARIPMSDLANANNTILINTPLNWIVTIGCKAQVNTTAETAGPDDAYFTIGYKATIILNTGSPTRIGSHLYSTDDDRITIQSTSAITTNHIQDLKSNAHFYSESTIAAGPYNTTSGANDSLTTQHRSQVPIISAASMTQNTPIPGGSVLVPATTVDKMQSWVESYTTDPMPTP